VTPQFGPSLIDNARVIIYDRNMFVTHPTLVWYKTQLIALVDTTTILIMTLLITTILIMTSLMMTLLIMTLLMMTLLITDFTYN